MERNRLQEQYQQEIHKQKQESEIQAKTAAASHNQAEVSRHIQEAMQKLDLERKQMQEQYKEELEAGKAMFLSKAKYDQLYNAKEVH
eukprot:4373660-Ditylum_brightwellii.AAC.1